MSKRHFLDFEQPIAELESKIDELRYVQNESAVDISDEIERLAQKSQQLTRDIYSSLTPWQVTSIARHPQRPYTLDYVEEIFTDFQELHGDRHFASDAVHVEQWQQMDDEAIIDELVAIRGIGRWTAEMFLIFHLMRPNVLPLDDIGLIRGISENYFSGEPVSRAEARELGEGWSPYRSVATWYIWRSLDPLPVDY